LRRHRTVGAANIQQEMHDGRTEVESHQCAVTGLAQSSPGALDQHPFEQRPTSRPWEIDSRLLARSMPAARGYSSGVVR